MSPLVEEKAGPTSGQEVAAASGFALLLAAALGGFGIVLAAIAIGAERAWNGRAGGTAAKARTSWGRFLDDQRAWLDHDAQVRAARRQARRDWWQAGADPAAKPQGPPWATRIGAGLRRGLSGAAVAADVGTRGVGRFGGGFRDGWHAAQQRRAGGAGFRDVVATPDPARPVQVEAVEDAPNPPGGRCGNCGAAVPDTDNICADCTPPPGTVPVANGKADTRPADDPAADPNSASPPAPPETPHSTGTRAVEDRQDPPTGPVDDDYRAPVDQEDRWVRRTTGKCAFLYARAEAVGGSIPAREFCDYDAEPGEDFCRRHLNNHDTTSTGGTDMTTATAKAPTGETNLDVTVGHLNNMSGQVARIAELNDQLSAAGAALQQAAARTAEHAAATGATAATQQALDEANAVAGLIRQQAAAMGDAATATGDQLQAASVGLRPAQDAQDGLHASGARGEFVSAASE